MPTGDDALAAGVAILEALERQLEMVTDQVRVLDACMHAGRALDRETAAAAAARLHDMAQLAERLLLFIPNAPAAASLLRLQPGWRAAQDTALASGAELAI